MKASIFYSWQSDLPGKTNRYYIEEEIKQAMHFCCTFVALNML